MAAECEFDSLSTHNNVSDNEEYQNGHIKQDVAYANHNTDALVEKSNPSSSQIKWRFKSNLYLLGVISCLLYFPYIALSDLQSSLFMDDGLGVICQAVLYVSFASSCLFLPPLCIRQLGHKWTILIAQLAHVIWMAANGYPTWLTMTTASCLAGIGAALLWTAFGSYINIISAKYAEQEGQSTEGITSLFFGIALAIFRSSRVFGSLLSWGILQNSMKNATAISEGQFSYCGANDCPWSNITSQYYEDPPKRLLWILIGCCVAIGIVSILVSVFCLDNLPKNWYILDTSPKVSLSQEIRHSVTSASRLHKDIRQWMLIPISFYYGMIYTFHQADFNKSFVMCTSGIWMVGIILVPNTVVSVIAAFLSGKLGHTFKSLPQFCLGFLLDCSILLTCLLWTPQPHQEYVLVILSTFLGISAAVWNTQTSATVGFVFSSQGDAAFANYQFWVAAGFSVMFGVSSVTCVDTRIYMTLSLLVVSIICLIILDRVTRRRQLANGRL